jgi:DNA-binding MarR family transcriptional regulator
MTVSSLRDFRRTLRMLEREIEHALQTQTQCCGVSFAQCHLLLTLEESGASTVGDLAARLELDPSTLSRTVDGLVKAGLAERREDPENRRRQIVTLSGTGKEKADSINNLCDRYYKRLLGSLPPAEADTLLAALPLLARALRTFRESERSAECCKLPGSPS